ncbi:MAG: amino acid ABC transporter permease, partial [Acidimicrobiia bacterium]
MSNVLFDTPGPRTRARHRVYTGVSIVALLGVLALVVARMGSTGQLSYARWEPFVTPAYVRALLLDGLVHTLEMAFSAVLLAILMGLLLGLGKMSEHRVL